MRDYRQQATQCRPNGHCYWQSVRNNRGLFVHMLTFVFAGLGVVHICTNIAGGAGRQPEISPNFRMDIWFNFNQLGGDYSESLNYGD